MDLGYCSSFYMNCRAHKECLFAKKRYDNIIKKYFEHLDSKPHLLSWNSGSMCSSMSMLNEGFSVMLGTSSRDSSSPGESWTEDNVKLFVKCLSTSNPPRPSHASAHLQLLSLLPESAGPVPDQQQRDARHEGHEGEHGDGRGDAKDPGHRHRWEHAPQNIVLVIESSHLR